MIKPNLRFDDFCDFYDRKNYIKDAYINLSPDDKRVYKYYIYSRRIIREKMCDTIWGFLNAEDTEELVIYLSQLRSERGKYK